MPKWLGIPYLGSVTRSHRPTLDKVGIYRRISHKIFSGLIALEWPFSQSSLRGGSSWSLPVPGRVPSI